MRLRKVNLQKLLHVVQQVGIISRSVEELDCNLFPISYYHADQKDRAWGQGHYGWQW